MARGNDLGLGLVEGGEAAGWGYIAWCTPVGSNGYNPVVRGIR
jgi:hypothetical protein